MFLPIFVTICDAQKCWAQFVELTLHISYTCLVDFTSQKVTKIGRNIFPLLNTVSQRLLRPVLRDTVQSGFQQFRFRVVPQFIFCFLANRSVLLVPFSTISSISFHGFRSELSKYISGYIKDTCYVWGKKQQNLQPLDVLVCNSANKPSFSNPTKVLS